MLKQDRADLPAEQFKAGWETVTDDMDTDLDKVPGTVSAPAVSGKGSARLQRTAEGMQQQQLGRDKRDVNRRLEALSSDMTELKPQVELAVTMLMAERADAVEIPRQACVLPGGYAQFGNWDNLRKPEVWTKTLEEWVASGYKAGKEFWKRRMRLLLVCAHTHQLVPCGHNGRGYKVQRYRKWARVTFDVAKFVLQATCATLAAMVVGQLPSTSGFGDQLVDAAVSRLQERLEASVPGDRDGQVGVRVVWVGK